MEKKKSKVWIKGGKKEENERDVNGNKYSKLIDLESDRIDREYENGQTTIISI